MIALDEQALQAIGNARALLDAMLTSAWDTVHVDGPEGAYFLAREAGVIDPLRAPPVASETAPPLPTAAPATQHMLTAPHVGSVVSLLPVGNMVEAGQVIAVLAILNEMVDVLATHAGVIGQHIATTGDLAEYGTVLLELHSL